MGTLNHTTGYVMEIDCFFIWKKIPIGKNLRTRFHRVAMNLLQFSNRGLAETNKPLANTQKMFAQQEKTNNAISQSQSAKKLSALSGNVRSLTCKLVGLRN